MNDYKKRPFDLSKAKTPENLNGLEVVTIGNEPVTIVSTNYRGDKKDYPILGIVHLEIRDLPTAFNIQGKSYDGYIFKGSIYLKEPIERRRMTNQELSKWLREKPEEFREAMTEHHLVKSAHAYFQECENHAVEDGLMIRSNYGKWREPLVEI